MNQPQQPTLGTGSAPLGQRPEELQKLELHYQELAQHDIDTVNTHLLQFCSGMIVAATALMGFLAGRAPSLATLTGRLHSTVLRLFFLGCSLWFLVWFLGLSSIVCGIIYLSSSARAGLDNAKQLQSIANGIHVAASVHEVPGIVLASGGNKPGQLNDSGSKWLTVQAACLLVALLLAPLPMLWDRSTHTVRPVIASLVERNGLCLPLGC
jgi:hypothetical protein